MWSPLDFRTEKDSDVFISIVLVIIGFCLGVFAIYHFTGTSTDQEKLRGALGNRETAKDAQELADSAQARLVGGHISSLVKIATAQLQQSFLFITWDWGWPDLLVGVRLWIGSFVLPDIATITNADCLTGGGGDTTAMRGIALPLVVLLFLICVGCCSCCIRCKAGKGVDDVYGQTTTARGAHMSNFGWALFTLASPIAMAGIAQLMTLGAGHVVFIIMLVPPFMLIIPLFAVVNMPIRKHLPSPSYVSHTNGSLFQWNLRKGKAAGVLHSPSFAARYGWLCSRYGAVVCRYRVVSRLMLTTMHCQLAVTAQKAFVRTGN